MTNNVRPHLSANVGELVVDLDNIGVNQNGTATVYRPIYDRKGNFKKYKKVDTFEYSKEMDLNNPGYAMYVGNMQQMVDAYKSDYAIKLSYDLGDKGGTYFSKNLSAYWRYVIIPRNLAVEAYDNNKREKFVEGISEGIDTAIANVVAGYIQDAFFKSLINSNYKFINFSYHTGWFSDEEYATGIDEMNAIGHNVGTFFYGSYMN